MSRGELRGLVMQAIGLGISPRAVALKLGITEAQVWQAQHEPRHQPAPELKPKPAALWQRQACEVCGEPLPYQRSGRKRVRHTGACAAVAKAGEKRVSRAA